MTTTSKCSMGAFSLPDIAAIALSCGGLSCGGLSCGALSCGALSCGGLGRKRAGEAQHVETQDGPRRCCLGGRGAVGRVKARKGSSSLSPTEGHGPGPDWPPVWPRIWPPIWPPT